MNSHDRRYSKRFFTLLACALVALSARSALAQGQDGVPPLPPASAPAPSAPAPASASPAGQQQGPAAAEAVPEPSAERPLRQGFTLELGLGAALTHVSVTGGEAKTSFGLAPLSLSLGGFLTPDVALLARIAGTSYFDKGASGDTTQFASGFYGAHLQYWVDDRFMLSGGPGFMLFGENSFISAGAKKPLTGYGASVRAAYAFYAGTHHALRIALEAFPAKYEEAFVLGTALNFEWQYY
jgi:hypothetical protein